jgi:hypothetical protein
MTCTSQYLETKKVSFIMEVDGDENGSALAEERLVVAREALVAA